VRGAGDDELERSVAALLAMPSAFGAGLGKDDDDVLFFSDRGGSVQLWRIGPQDATPTLAVTGWDRSVASFVSTADGRWIVFGADRDGDEVAQLHRAPAGGGEATLLTPTTLARDAPIAPTRAAKEVFYSARVPGEAATSIYALAVDGSAPERAIYRDDGAGFLVDVAPDGKRALFLQFRSHQDNVVLLVDVATGKAHTLHPASGSATVRAAAFSADGKRVFVATDDGGEQSLVVALDAKSGRELARHVESEATGAVGESISVAPTGDRIAVAFDAGDHGVVRMLDADRLTPIEGPNLPLGYGMLGPFTRDGRELLLSWSSIEHPMAVLRWDLAKKELRPVVAAEARTAPEITADIERVRSFDGLEIPVNVIRPQGSGRMPVIVDFHGGPAGSAAMRWSAHARFFVEQGYVWVAPNIRGSGGFGRGFEAMDDGAKRDDAFRDIDALHAWIVAQPWADAERLVISGSSFGGYLVLHELTDHPTRWRAGIDMFGIADFIGFMATTTGLVRENYLHEIGDPVKDRALLERLSPLARAARIRAPLFVYAGANDPRVPRAQSDAIVSTLREQGIAVEYMLAPDEGHGADRHETRIELLVRMAAFLRRELGDSQRPSM
jgi:dipeptidyl aminopeptidase/acylaminoacyl peptidase